MAWTVDDVLIKKNVRDARIYTREVSFRLGELRSKIHIRLYRQPGDREVYFEQSHFIRIPEKVSAYVPNRNSDLDEAYALSLAMEPFLHLYDAAVKQGLEPSETWLLANEDF